MPIGQMEDGGAEAHLALIEYLVDWMGGGGAKTHLCFDKVPS